MILAKYKIIEINLDFRVSRIIKKCQYLNDILRTLAIDIPVVGPLFARFPRLI